MHLKHRINSRRAAGSVTHKAHLLSVHLSAAVQSVSPSAALKGKLSRMIDDRRSWWNETGQYNCPFAADRNTEDGEGGEPGGEGETTGALSVVTGAHARMIG